jgi:ABC-type transporter Mla MlaB component
MMVRKAQASVGADTDAAGPVGRLVLDGALTIREIEDMHARLRDTLGAHGDVDVDCGQATDIDLSAVQLLVAARRTAAARGTRLDLVRPAGPALTAALTRGGYLTADGRPTSADAAWLIGMDMP